MDSNYSREVCKSCCKQVYIHQKVLICQLCHEILHYKCGKLTYTYNQINDQWTCNGCSQHNLNKYNPFNSMCSNKYLADDPDACEEIDKIKNCLNNCKVFSKLDINKQFFWL